MTEAEQKRIARKIEEIRALIRDEITPFRDTGGDAAVARRHAGKADFETFCRTYLPNYFTSPSAAFHSEIDEVIERRGAEIIGLVAPREHAKTVRYSVAYSLHQIVYRLRRYIVLISETEMMAVSMALNIRAHFECNARLRADFGDLVNPGAWAENEFVVRGGIKVEARGYRQPVRGLLFGPHRPDYIRIDDLTSLKSARNEMLEREKLEWVLGEVGGCMSADGTLLWTGNILRKTSAIAQLETESRKPEREIVFRRYPAILPDGSLLWPQRYSVEYFERIKRQRGSLVFEREYQQNPIEEGVFYRAEWFNPFTLGDAIGLWGQMDRRIIYIDPSYGSKRKTARSKGSDMKVAVVMSRNKLGCFIFDAICRQTTLQSFGAAVCKLYTTWNVPVVWYEGNFGQKDIIGDYLRAAAQAMGIELPIRAYYNFGHKADRIQKGSPLAEQGRLFYCTGISDVQDVIDNLVTYDPRRTDQFDDPADAFASGLEILERGPVEITARTFSKGRTVKRPIRGRIR